MNKELREEETPATESPMNIPQYQLQLSEDLQKEIVALVKSDYEKFKDDRDNRDYGTNSKGDKPNFDKWFKSLKDLYRGEREPKDTPWKFCSNRSMKITAGVIDMMVSRFYPMIVNESLLKWKTMKAVFSDRVEKISKLMRWWIFVNSKLRPFYDNLTKLFTSFGDLMVETYWDEKPKTIRTIEEPVLDSEGNQVVDETGAPVSKRTFQVIETNYKTSSRIYTRDKFYLKKGSRDIQEETVILEDEYFFHEIEDGAEQGKFINVDKLKETIPVDVQASSMLSPEELEKIKKSKMRHECVKILRAYLRYDVNGDGFSEQILVYVNPEHDIYLGGVDLLNITKSGNRPIEHVKFDSRLEDPEENFGEGVIEKIKELAEEIDAIFNQMTDANTMNVMSPIFVDPFGNVDSENLKLGPNKIINVPSPSQNVYIPERQMDSTMFLNAIRLVMEFIERLTAASSYVMGKESDIGGGSGTATRTQAIMLSAEQRLALPAERLRTHASHITRHHLDILQKNMPEGMDNKVLGDDGTPVFGSNELSQLGIEGEYDCWIEPDPSFGSKDADRELASMFYSILLQNIIVGTDPAKIYKITADYLKAYDKNPVEYLGPPPEEDKITDPDDENTLLIRGEFGQVKASITENHILHIKRHEDLLKSPDFVKISQMAPELFNQIMQFAQNHIMEHQQMMQMMMAMMQQTAGGKGGKPGKGPASEGAGGPSSMETATGPVGRARDASQQGTVAPTTAV